MEDSNDNSNRRTFDMSFSKMAGLLMAWVVATCNLFFEFYASKGQSSLGDRGDGRFIATIADHWNQVFAGNTAWNSPSFLWPVEGVLGFSDGLFLIGVLRSFLGIVFLNSYMALMVSLLALSFVGFFSMYILMASRLRVTQFLSAACAMYFVSFNGLVNISGHPQMLTIWMIPVVILFMWPDERKTYKYPFMFGTSAGLVLASIFLTSFYVAWFFVVVCLISLVFFVFYPGLTVSSKITFGKEVAFTRRFLAFTISFLIGMIPFLFLYFPLIRNGQGRSYDEILSFALLPRDFFNIGPNNLVWSEFVTEFNIVPMDRLYNLEINNVMTPTLLICALVFSIFALKDSKIPFSLALIAVLVQLLTVKFGDLSMWRLIWEIPGASGIRAIGRIALFSSSLAMVSVALSVNELISRPRHNSISFKTIVISLVVMVILFEQINVKRSYLIDVAKESTFENSFSPPSLDCEAFAVTGTNDNAWYLYQLDAMRLAMVFNIPTVNGYSGLQPEGWNLFQPQSPDYEMYLSDWKALMGYQEEVCIVNVDNGEWNTQTLNK
jgi:hypothetical protein